MIHDKTSHPQSWEGGRQTGLGTFRISGLRWHGCWEGGRQNWLKLQNFKLKVIWLRRWQANWWQFQNLKLQVTWLGRWQANWLKHQNVTKFWLWMNVMGARSHILSRNKRNDELRDAVVKTIAALPRVTWAVRRRNMMWVVTVSVGHHNAVCAAQMDLMTHYRTLTSCTHSASLRPCDGGQSKPAPTNALSTGCLLWDHLQWCSICDLTQ